MATPPNNSSENSIDRIHKILQSQMDMKKTESSTTSSEVRKSICNQSITSKTSKDKTPVISSTVPKTEHSTTKKDKNRLSSPL